MIRHDDDPIDLADPRSFVEHDTNAFWRRTRDEDPVHWQPPTDSRPGFWAVSRHSDVQRIHRDTTSYSSARGNVLDALLAGGDSGSGSMLPVTDAPRHTDLRAVMRPYFTRRRLAEISERVRVTARRLVEHSRDLGTCDFAAEVAEPLPGHTVCDVLDVPEADRRYLLKSAQDTLASTAPDTSVATIRAARNEVVRYFLRLAETRRSHPGGDLVSAMTSSQVSGQPLTDEDVALNCYSLLLGGDETGRLAISTAGEALAAHPEQWKALKAGHADVATATEELLRWATPAMHTARHATQDTSLHGRQILAGDIVTLWLSSANRDERAFPEPDRLDLRRSPNHHLTFGLGTHFCIGAHLARVEMHAVLLALTELVGDIRPAGPGRRVLSTFLSGYSALPLTLSP